MQDKLHAGQYIRAPAASPGTVAAAVAVEMVAETPRESAVEAAVGERALAMPLSSKIVPWVVAA
jgi:hypothetical protein